MDICSRASWLLYIRLKRSCSRVMTGTSFSYHLGGTAGLDNVQFWSLQEERQNVSPESSAEISGEREFECYLMGFEEASFPINVELVTLGNKPAITFPQLRKKVWCNLLKNRGLRQLKLCANFSDLQGFPTTIINDINHSYWAENVAIFSEGTHTLLIELRRGSESQQNILLRENVRLYAFETLKLRRSISAGTSVLRSEKST